MPNTNGKLTLEELLNQSDLQELKDLQKSVNQWKNDKKGHNLKQLKDISLAFEKIVSLLEKQDNRQKELERKFNEVSLE
jgi:hypothetical protein